MLNDLKLNGHDLRLIGYALEHYSVGTDWSAMHKAQIVRVLQKAITMRDIAENTVSEEEQDARDRDSLNENTPDLAYLED